MTKESLAPEPLKSGPSQDHIAVNGIDLRWNIPSGTFTFQGLPVAMMWVDSTLASLMSGLATMVGPERFALALQSEGRKSVESDWALMANYPNFCDGFAAIAIVAATAGWGQWQLLSDSPARRECRFRAFNTWEGLCQRTLKTCWGSAMLAGKLAGYCSKRFGTNCWATQTAFIAKGDPYDEFTVAPSQRSVEDEIAHLLSTDQATRADMAVALTQLRSVQAQLLTHQNTLEEQVRQRTEELAASFQQLHTANDRLRQEVAERTRSEEARKQSEELLHRIIDMAPMSMAIVSMRGTIDFINRKAIATFGYHPEEIPTMEEWWVKAFPDAACRAEVIARWTNYLTVAQAQGGEIARDDYHITCKDGTVKTISAFGVIVAETIFVMFDDITLQTLRETLLRQSNADLERHVQERTAQLANHNLALERNAALLRRLSARLAQTEELERKRMAQILHDQLQQLLVAANFSIATLERGLSDPAQLLSARSASAAIAEAIRESKSLVLELSPPILREGGLAPAMKWLGQRMLEKHGLRVNVHVDERAQIIGDDLRVAIFQGVRELLFNVTKHAGVKEASVVVIILPESRVQIVVSDEGRGYSPSKPEHGEELELGFGHVALRERCESAGGSMVVASAPGKGCRVTLTLPIDRHGSHVTSRTAPRPIPERDAAATSQAEGTTDTPRIRILLADDHTILRQGLSSHLARDPALTVVGEAADGDDAIAQARALRPDVILMDVGMPRMNGIEATRAIHAEFPEMIVIGLSMYAEPHRIEEMRRAGAAAYLSKSEAAETLVATIHACCGR